MIQGGESPASLSHVRIRAEGVALERLRAALPVGLVVRGRVLEELPDGRSRIEIRGGRGEEKPIVLTAEGFPVTKAQGDVELRVASHEPRIVLRPVATRLASWGIPETAENLRLFAALTARGVGVTPEIFRRLASEAARTGIPPEALAFFHAKGLPRTRETAARLARSGTGEVAKAFQKLDAALARNDPDGARALIREALVWPATAKHPILHEKGLAEGGEGSPAKGTLLRLIHSGGEASVAARELLEALEGRVLVADAPGFLFLTREEDSYREVEIRAGRAEDGATRIFLRVDTAEGEVRAALDFTGKEIGASFRFEAASGFEVAEAAGRRRAARGELGQGLATQGFRLGAFSVDADPLPASGSAAVGLDLRI